MRTIDIASEAVNKRDIKMIEECVKFVLLPPSGFDPRDLVTGLSLVSDALMRIGMNPQIFIERISQEYPDYIYEEVQKFFKRTPENRSLKAMGFDYILYKDNSIQYIDLRY